MNRLINRLIDDLRRQVQQRAQACGLGRDQVRRMIFFVFMQTNPPDQLNMDLIGDRDGTYQIGPTASTLLGNSNQRRNAVAGMRIVSG